MIGMRHGFKNLSQLKMHMKPINPNHHFSQSNVVSVLDHPIKIENDSMFFEDLKDDKRFVVDHQFKFNYTNVNNDPEDIKINTINQDKESVPEVEKKNMELDKVDCQSVAEFEIASESVKD